MLKVLDEMRIPISCVTGTSMGAIVAGTFAAGRSPAKLEQLVLEANWNEIFRDKPSRDEIAMRRKADDYKTLFAPEFGVKDGGLALPKGVIAGVSIEAFFRVLVEPAMGITDFKKLPIPYEAMATNIETGQSVVLDHGSLAEAMRASMSVPGALAPVEIDGNLLVDGGIANNLPIDQARKLCADVIIAVNISTPPMKRKDLTSALAVAGQLVNFLGKQTVDDQLKSLGPGDVLIEPDLGTISAASFERSKDAIRIGEEATRAMAAKLERYSLPPEQYAALRAKQVVADGKPLGTVAEIRFEGLERTNPEVLRGLVRTQPGEALSEEKIGEDLRRIYGRGDFEGVNYHLEGDNGPRAMVIKPREKLWGPDYLRFGLGLASDFQGDNAFNVLVQYRRTWLNRLGAEWTTEGQVGQDTHLYSEFFQPLNEKGIWFGSVYGQVGQVSRVAVRRRQQGRGIPGQAALRGGVDAGAVIGTAGIARLGAPMDGGRRARGHRRPDPAVDPRADGRPARVGLIIDQLDHALFPREGYSAILTAYAATTALGSALDYQRLEGKAEFAKSWGPAHAEPLRARRDRFRLGHAGIRVVHAGRSAAAVGIPRPPVLRPPVCVRPRDVLQADRGAARPAGLGRLRGRVGGGGLDQGPRRRAAVAGNAVFRLAVPGRGHLRRPGVPGRGLRQRRQLQRLPAARRAVSGARSRLAGIFAAGRHVTEWSRCSRNSTRRPRAPAIAGGARVGVLEPAAATHGRPDE